MGDDLVLAVTDDGREPAKQLGANPGYGLLGMRERAISVGGLARVRAGSRWGLLGESRTTREGENVMPIRIVIADDQPLVRAGLRMLLSSVTDIEVVGEATNGEEAVTIAHELAPTWF